MYFFLLNDKMFNETYCNTTISKVHYSLIVIHEYVSIYVNIEKGVCFKAIIYPYT